MDRAFDIEDEIIFEFYSLGKLAMEVVESAKKRLSIQECIVLENKLPFPTCRFALMACNLEDKNNKDI